jgi:hypothetical protein
LGCHTDGVLPEIGKNVSRGFCRVISRKILKAIAIYFFENVRFTPFGLLF